MGGTTTFISGSGGISTAIGSGGGELILSGNGGCGSSITISTPDELLIGGAPTADGAGHWPSEEDPARRIDVIQKRGSKWVLLSKKTGKVIGTHPTKEAAEAQERAVQASKHSDSEEPVRVRRFDSGELAAPVRLPNGFLKAEGRISRTGIQEYSNPGGGMHRELRLPEEVFSPESMASFHLVPVTNTHPSGLLTAQDAKRYSVGSVGENVRRDGDFLAASMMITDADAIVCAELGRSELSCGYGCELDATQHENLIAEWGPYDFIQRNIRGNHVALVDEARAGAGAAIRLDENDSVMIASSTKTVTNQEKTMPQSVKIDGISMEVTDANAPAIQQAFDRLLASSKKDAAEEVSTIKKNLDSALAGRKTAATKLGKLLARIDAAKAALKAVKHEVMTCPSCSGSKETEGEDGKMAKCDYCDGAGKVSALGEFGGETKGFDNEEDPDEMDAEMPMSDEGIEEGMDAPTELEVEQATEEEAKGAHKDARDRIAKIRKRRSDAMKKFSAAAVAKSRIDGIVRTKLETEARKHLGDDAKLDGLEAADIRRKVVEKLKPGVKLDGMTLEQVSGAFAVLCDSAPTPSDTVRGKMLTPSVNAAPRADASASRDRMIKSNQDAWKRAAK